MEDRQLSIGQALAEHAARTPHAPAIIAPGRAPLSYAQLAAHIDDMGAALRALGLGRHARVALVVPTGPEMAVTFLAIATWAVCAPLSPSYQAQEYAEYLTALKVSAVLVQEGDDSTEAVAAAQRLSLPVIRIAPLPDAAAGLVTLDATDRLPVDSDDRADPDDLAVVILTSGTTARPKVVPLTHRNLCASAQSTGRAVALTPDDRCLNIPPLFYIHGFCMVLASLLAGASVVCPPPFEARTFFAWLDECYPTWYVAGPSAHREILAVADAAPHRAAIARSPLRLIRSGSASLPENTLRDLERTFGAPVIEAYGMTEAGPLIACNPLPPGIRKLGSVGLPVGPEVAIIDSQGEVLPAGQEGEIVARGASIMAGYEDNDAANREAFIEDWLRTGDLGYLDHEGYLFITGRVKELINRGGQKVSPYEVEAVLLDHPSVAQAVVFALPHPTLGEDVGAAVVLHPGMTASVEELRSHVAERLAPFKVPRKIVTVERLPTSAAGKVQRLGLADRLGLALRPTLSSHSPLPPTTPLETQLVQIWEDLLGIHSLGIEDDFFDLGGHSLLAARLMERIRETFHRDLPVSILYQNGTIARLAVVLGTDHPSTPWPSLVAIQPQGLNPPFFCVHALFGDVDCYADLARRLGPDQPVYGLQAQGLDGSCAPLTRIDSMAAHYVEEMRTVQPRGPYSLGGYSGGGTIALEMAQQLRASGEEVALLAMFDSPCPGSDYDTVTWNRGLARHIGRSLLINAPYWLATGLRHGPGRLLTLVRQGDRPGAEVLNAFARRYQNGAAHANFEDLRGLVVAVPGLRSAVHWPDHRFAVVHAFYQGLLAYTPVRYPGRVTLFRAHRQPIRCSHRPTMGWETIAEAGVEIHVTPGGHNSMLYQPYVRVLARKLTACLQ